MNPALSPFACDLPGSGIREIFNLALGRDDVIHLELGEPDFPTPAHIVEAAFEAARKWSGYTHTAGLSELREAIAARLERVHGLRYEPDRVVVTHGAAQGIAAVMGAVVAPGDEVLIPDPGWPNYLTLALAHGGVPVPYPLHAKNGFVADPNEVAGLIGPRTKLLILNSPSNPTGAVFSAGVLADLVDVARRSGVLVLSDEVYDEMVFEGSVAPSAAVLDPEAVVGVWSCSKTYAMTGWRVGYLAASASLVPALTKVQEAMITCASSVSQAAALAALGGPQDCVAHMRDAYRHRRDLVVKLLTDAGITPVSPEGAFYLMVPLSGRTDSRAVALELVDHGLAVAPGSAFGRVAEGHLRLSLAAAEETLERAAERYLGWLGPGGPGGGASGPPG